MRRHPMNWRNIIASQDYTYFIFDGKQLFHKKFIEVLKFHEPGFAAVCDERGWFHINVQGESIYSERYKRTFGFYQERASVIAGDQWFHIDIKGNPVYQETYAFTGNFQEEMCVVRDFQCNYFHIDLNGKRVYSQNYRYCGDYKDGYACIMLESEQFKHIDKAGKYIYQQEFEDLGVFHKRFATAKDKTGWFHINLFGEELYKERYAYIEPFYNGCALVQSFWGERMIIAENGKIINRL